jgi:putative endopeptidase
MTDKTEQRLHELIEAVAAKAEHEPASTEGKVGAFYKSFMNEAAVEKAGASPLKDHLAEIRTAQTREALATLMGRQNADLHGTILHRNRCRYRGPDRYVVYLGQAGLGLPDRDYYLKPDFAAQKSKYQAYAAQLLKLLAWPEAEARAGDIINLEAKIAEAGWTRAQQRDPIATYNPMSIAELETLAPNFPWRPFFPKPASESGTRRGREKSAFPKIATIFAETPDRGLASMAGFQCRRSRRALSREAFRRRRREMRSKTPSARPNNRSAGSVGCTP